MDRKQVSGKGRIKASSIMEVIISMVVIVVVFGIAMMIYSNVIRLSFSAKKLKAAAVLKEALINAEEGMQQEDRSFTLEDIQVEQKVAPYPGVEGLLEIRLVAYDENKEQLAQLQKLITNE
jgi:hypothetical protein